MAAWLKDHHHARVAKAQRLTGASTLALAITVCSGYLQPALAQTPAIQLEEVVVTAEKRAQSLQDVPIAITAVTGETLAARGISQPTDLNKLAPGLGIAQGGASTQVYLRGVGNYGTSAFADPAIAFNIDGVYISRFSGISGNFFDVDRIEVLKGPQGTLYGRNATGGAINIITKKPNLAGFSAEAGVELGNYDLVRLNGMVNAPISDQVALRLAIQDTSRDGYQSDGYDDDQTTGARLQLLYEPNDATSLLLSGSYLKVGGKGPAHVPVTNTGFVDNDNPWKGLSQTLPGLLATPPIYGGVDRTSGKTDVVAKSLGAQFERELSDTVTLDVVASYIKNDNKSRGFGPGFLADTRTLGEQKSIEARLSGATDRLNWVAGVYGFRENQSEHFWVDQGFQFNQTGMAIDALKTKALAAFGQATYKLTDQLRLTGGLRLSKEEKSVDGFAFTRQPATATCAASGTTPVLIGVVATYLPQAAVNGDGTPYPFVYCQDPMKGQREWKDTSWRVALDYDVTPSSLLYVSASRGFKAGGFFPAGNASITGNSFEPETLYAYAFGSKNRFLGGRVQLNAEAFYWDYRDHQESYLAPTSNAGTFNFITQRADGEIYGLDADLSVLLSDNDELNTKLQYLHARYTDAPFLVASPGPGNPAPRTSCTATQDAASPALYHSDCSGQQMPRSPTLSGVMDYHHTFRLGTGAKVEAGANLRYSASYWSAVDYNPLQKQDAFTTIGLSLAYHNPDDTWSITAYGENLTKEVIYTNAFMYPSKNSVTNGGAGDIAMVQLDAPRTYGVRLKARF